MALVLFEETAVDGLKMRRRHHTHLALAALAVVAGASCGGGQVGTGSSELSAAIDRMSSLQSVRMVGHGSGPDTTNDVVTLDYRAPDRLHIVQTGTEANESFQVGSTLYQQEVGRPGYFRAVTLPPSHTTARSAVFGVLEAMKGRSGTRHGATYRRTLPNGAGSMTAKVEDGYVTELTTDSGGVRRVQQYSLFNNAPDVSEPPADRVLGSLPTAAKCVGGQPPPSTFLCLD